MTRDECLLKLLAIEPERHDRIRRITGWPPDETDAVLRRLLRAGHIAWIQTVCQGSDYRVYHRTTSRRGARA